MVRAVLTGRLTVSGFDLALFRSLFSHIRLSLNANRNRNLLSSDAMCLMQSSVVIRQTTYFNWIAWVRMHRINYWHRNHNKRTCLRCKLCIIRISSYLISRTYLPAVCYLRQDSHSPREKWCVFSKLCDCCD